MSHWQYRPFHITATQATATAIGNNVATTSSTTITAGPGVVVTPASMANITVGRWLNFSGGTGTFEDVLVKSIDTVGGTSLLTLSITTVVATRSRRKEPWISAMSWLTIQGRAWCSRSTMAIPMRPLQGQRSP